MVDRKAALAAAVSVFAISAGAPALAQVRPGDVVYVYGSSLESTLPQELARYGSDLVSIGRDSIVARNYVDAHQALQMEIPGLYISPAGPFSYSDVSIQGSRIGDVLWLVDGVRINNRLYPGTLTDTIPANMVERIEVLKGGESLFYGTGAAGGVINIVTRDFSDELGGEFSAGADTNESTSVSGMVRGALGPGNFVLYGGWDQSDGVRAFSRTEPSTTMTHREYDVWNIGAKYGLDVTPDLRIVGQYQHTDAAIANTNATQIASSFNNRNEEIASVRIDYTPGETAQFFLKGYYHDWDTLYDRVRNSVTAPGQTTVDFTDALWGYEDYGVNALGKFRFSPAFETLVGYDFQRYSAVDDVWRIAPMEEEVHAVFGQLRTTEDLIENGSFAVGVRYNDTGGANATVWNASGRYELSQTLYMQGSVSTNFLLPSAEQLFLNEPCCEAGNPNLEPEESINANLSLGGVTSRAYWQVTGFWREIENIITADYTDPAFPNGVFVNGDGKVEVRGFELLGGWSFTDELSAEASYTNTRARQEGATGQFNRIPREFAKASLNYDAGQFGGSFAARWNGDVYAPVTGLPGRVNYGDYIVADLSGFFYVDRDRKHQISLRLENILDRKYGRFGSDLTDAARASGGAERFLYQILGSPQTLHVAYRYTF